MANCSFCKKSIEQGTGKLLIMKDGRTFNFCSMKCEKNQFKLKRLPRKTKWTGEAHKAKEDRK